MLRLFQDSLIFEEATSSQFFIVTTSTQQLLFQSSYFFRTAFFEDLLFQNSHFFTAVISFQNNFFFRAKRLQSSNFLRIAWRSIFFFSILKFTRVNIKFKVASHISTMICLGIKKVIIAKK